MPRLDFCCDDRRDVRFASGGDLSTQVSDSESAFSTGLEAEPEPSPSEAPHSSGTAKKLTRSADAGAGEAVSAWARGELNGLGQANANAMSSDRSFFPMNLQGA